MGVEPAERTRQELTADLLALAGLDPGLAHTIGFTGPPSVLPSSFRVTDASCALVAAFSAAVAAVAMRRSPGMTPPAISVDSVAAAAAFQSERHLRVDRRASPLWDPLSGHYRAADGHVQFHTNFPHHRAALLAATGCGPDDGRARVEAAVRERGRFELETAVAAAGGIAAALRSPAEWRAEPHAAHVDGRPALRLDAVGGGSPGDGGALGPAPAERPLAGIRVLDLTRVIAGPVCTRSLAAYGAEVLRIGADGLPVVDSLLPDTTLGKRFANCDLGTAAGLETVLGLAAGADVVVTGYRPGALAGRGLTVERLLARNPRLVLGRLSAFGDDGPWGGRRGFDSITQTATGIVAAETAAFAAEVPRPLPCQLLDHGSGFLLALGVMAALLRRDRTGAAHEVEVSLLTTRNWLAALGRVPIDGAMGLDDAAVADHLEARPSPFGPLRHVRHPGRIDGIPARWDHGPSRPGADLPHW